MASQGQLGQAETADEYGRRARCFADHRANPFSFAACVASLKTTMVKAGENKLLNQIALQDLVPSCPLVLDDELQLRDDLVGACLELPQDPARRIPPLIQGLDVFKSLLISTEPLALGSDPETDLRDYHKIVSNKRFGEPLKTWLPLAQLNFRKDGESPSTPHSDRLQSPMQRQVENESILLPNGALAILEELHHPGPVLSRELQDYLDKMTSLESTSHPHPEPMTPPILSSSDHASPFVPVDDSNIIDLTSPPSTPVNEQRALLEKNVEHEQPISGPNVPIALTDSSPSQNLSDILPASRPSIQGLEMDVPVMISSDPTCEENPLQNSLPLFLDEGEILAFPDGQEERPDNAFESLVHERASLVQALAEQENLNILTSGSRVQVPILSFDIPRPVWTTKTLSAETHFQHLQGEMGNGFMIHPVPRDFGSESSLRWNPVPPKHTHVSAEEKLPCQVGAAETLLGRAEPMSSSASFFAPKQDLAILNETEDMELDIDDGATSLTTDEDEQPQPPFTILNGDCEIRSRPEARPSPLPAQGWSTFLGSVSRELLDVETNFLPRPSDTSATSALVASFMQLRGKEPKPPKDQKLKKHLLASFPQTTTQAPPSVEESPFVSLPKVPAVAPEVQIPEEKGPFIISLALGKSIISHLEANWPSSKLIDVDFSRHNASSATIGGTHPQGPAPPHSFEADVALSPSTGIVVTNLLKVRQRVLPGSNALAPLRERIKTVSQKYETLYVLVSEHNPSGEFTTPLSPSDAAAYAALVRFAVALHAGLVVVLVPGADATLANWVLGLMCQHSARAASLARFLAARECPWELLLRQAGFNVAAARVLAGSLLEDAGPSGLARYIVTPVRERVARYAGILGGEKVIRSSSERLDRGWG